MILDFAVDETYVTVVKGMTIDREPVKVLLLYLQGADKL
jgi:hypothetical protein